MPYINPQDIREHLRGSGSIAQPAIVELMTAVEKYVSMRLNMNPLPENNEILADIIRELTISKVIVDLLHPTSEDLARADFHRRNGLQMIADVNRDGLFPSSLGSRDVAREVYNPYAEQFFKQEDFLL